MDIKHLVTVSLIIRKKYFLTDILIFYCVLVDVNSSIEAKKNIILLKVLIYIVLLSKLFLAPWISFTIKKLWILIWFRFIRTIKKDWLWKYRKQSICAKMQCDILCLNIHWRETREKRNYKYKWLSTIYHNFQTFATIILRYTTFLRVFTVQLKIFRENYRIPLNYAKCTLFAPVRLISWRASLIHQSILLFDFWWLCCEFVKKQLSAANRAWDY